MRPLVVLASIPSPGGNAIRLGPLQLRAYGLAIAIGVLVAVVVAQRRWAARGGDPADISSLAVWSVTAGLIGARAYHVITDHQRFQGRWLHAFAVWEGGLGIPGGLLVGVVTGVNIWVSILAVTGAAAWLILYRRPPVPPNGLRAIQGRVQTA